MAPDRRPPFSVVVRRTVRLRDCLALAVVPAVLVGVFLSPVPFRQSLTFAYADPTAASAVAAHFVHFSAEHLAANLVGYAVLAGLGYLLAVLSDCRRLFGVAAATYVIGFPPVLSALNLAIPRRAVGYGFSGINMAFAGLLPVILAIYAGRRLDPRIRIDHAPVLFFGALTLVALSIPGSRLGTGLGLAVASGAATVWYAGSALSAVRGEPPRSHDAVTDHPGWLEAFVFGVGASPGYVAVDFFGRSVVGSTVVNHYVHLLGFCLAFIAPYVAVELGVFDVGSDPE